MPRFLTAEWVVAFNGALAGIQLPVPGPDAGLAAIDGQFTVAQEVRGAPEGDVRLLLTSADGALTLELSPLDDMGDGDGADVTIALDYSDAAALSRGTVTPAEALTAGRIRVRGDLSVLSASQAQLQAARVHTAAVDAVTSY